MRRLIIVLSALVMLFAVASPAAAARPVKDSGSYEFATAWASDCVQQGGNTLCTDTYVDVFGGSEWTDACVGVFTYTIGRNGQFRPGTDRWGCGPAGSFGVAGNGTSASLGSTTVDLFTCGPRRCTAAGSVTVSAEWTAIGSPMTSSGRSTFSDGNCTYRQSWKGVQSEASASITLNGSSLDGSGYFGREEYTVTERCR
jgi:hypothetical protein